ncbi:reverse transcriptase [Plakobranchus ocellatus]|uniref:Reverse transcriptase n=1 Tax=Plakobranchus ocellatus TaxID=259542 RepID=A0AAV3ZBN7_9GAST|nr:reverse transcriptase [Plakobranchus ocellatus]
MSVASGPSSVVAWFFECVMFLTGQLSAAGPGFIMPEPALPFSSCPVTQSAPSKARLQDAWSARFCIQASTGLTQGEPAGVSEAETGGHGIACPLNCDGKQGSFYLVGISSGVMAVLTSAALTATGGQRRGQVQNHSAKEIQAENRDDILRHPSDKRHKINFPPTSSGKQWEDLDSKIVLKIDSLLGKSTLEHKLATFGDIVYQICLDTFGAKQHQTKCPPQRSRRQLEMDTLRKQKKKLKKQIRAASSEETNGLLVIWRQLKARHLALRRAESARKKRSQKRKNQERFIRDPFQFARQLFQQPKSGTLTVEREELETHLKKTYSDPTREIPLEETTGHVWPAAPGIKFDNKPPSLQEVIAVVNKARAKSAPGPNGVPYLLYKRYPNVLKKLYKILRSAWKNIKISKEWMAAEVCISKEQDSKEINQFCPLSLLNVEGKIFFSFMASRLTKYRTENGYINTSVQKGGIPGVSGCLEHATMIWEAIQRAKSEKLNLDVVWLDLANAYGSVPHEMMQLALRMYHVPEVIQVMLDDYFKDETRRTLTRLDVLMSWCRMEFKPKKSRSLSIRSGKVDEVTTFTVAEQQIPTVSQEPVKSLGGWYDSSMKDTRRGAETLELASESLLAINK